MHNADIILKISYDLKKPGNTVIKTNAKKGAVESILEAWLSGQIGEGADKRKPNKKSLYQILIELDLSDDTFFTSSDTGNQGLTCGLVMDVFRNLNQIQILPLS